MQMKKSVIYFIFMLVGGLVQASNAPVISLSGSDLLDVLDRELDRRHIYTDIRRHKIDSVMQIIEVDSASAIVHNMDLGRLVEGLNADSAAMIYSKGFNLARSVGDSVSAQRYLIYHANVMGRLGAIPEAIEDLDHLLRVGLFDENRMLYLEVTRNLYCTYAEIFENTNVHDSYSLPGLTAARQLQSLMEPDSDAFKFNRGLIYLCERNEAMFLAHLTDLAGQISEDSEMYSFTMTALGGRYLIIGESEQSVKWLALGALNDIRNGDRQNTALIRLGCALYKLGDMARAHNYLSVALEDALKAGSKPNCLMISEALMPVAQELRSRDESRFMLLVGLVVSLIIGLLLFGYIYRSKYKNTLDNEKARTQLASANISKDMYISNFMGLCSSYMESFEDFNCMCRRKITAGKSEELLNFIKGEKIIEDQRKKFDDIFDDSFLNIYPSFITEVNKLLLSDKQIVTPGPDILTTELRVLAFTRLGVDDTASVARFLGLTLNTVYTYRNKLRNKAVSRETFDADVMKIGVID